MRSLLLVFGMGLGSSSLTAAEPAAVFQALPRTAPAPADNPSTPAKVELGSILFHDPRLSMSGTVSCNSCHNLSAGGDDSRPNSIGIGGQAGARSAPTVWNSGHLSVLFWDGRAASLEEQAKGPITNPIEMGMTNHDLAINRLKEIPDYKKHFEKAFGGKDAVTIENAAKAIAAFERTLNTPNSPFDRHLKGEKTALNTEAKKGLALFQEVGCVSCHQGMNLAGPALPAGAGFYQKFPLFSGTSYETRYQLTQDPGRFEVTRKEVDRQMWRVPSLRNIALTAPYFHNGSVPTLPEAVRVMAKTQLNRDLKDEEVDSLVAFLESLTGEFPELKVPRLPVLKNRSFHVLNEAASPVK
jgi:cytochrome c peroxidase